VSDKFTGCVNSKGAFMFYDKKIETLPRTELAELQLERLQMTLNRVDRSVAFYKAKFNEHAIDIGKIRSLSDLTLLPFTTKEDLSQSYPYGLFAVPLKDIVRIHSTAGTAGKPLVTGYTRSDIRNWSALVARLLTATGVTDHDLAMVAFNYSLFTGGLGFHYGAELLGASVVPASESSDIRKQFAIMKDYKTTVLASTPNYALKLIHGMNAHKLSTEGLSLRIGLFGAEPWTEAARGRIEDGLKIHAYDSYGISEILGPGISGECVQKNGLHIQEDHFLVEIIHPETGKEVQDGDEGEVVITTLTKEGFPLIRYRTGDKARILSGNCPCGRSFKRMGRVMGRTDDLIIVRGVKLHPSQIAEVLREVEKETPHWQAIIDQKDGMDELELKVGISEETIQFDQVRKLEKLKSDIVKQIRKELDISAKVSFVEPQSLQKDGTRNTHRVLDLRIR